MNGEQYLTLKLNIRRKKLGNAAVHVDNKPFFKKSHGKIGKNFEHFSLTRQTASAFVGTLSCHASLIEDLLSKGYGFALISRFQRDK